MIFSRTDDQRLLAESLRKLLDEKNNFEHRRQRLAAASTDRLALWPALAEMGLLGLCIDEARGGFGGDARSVATVMAELGRALAVEPFLGCAVVAAKIFERAAGCDEALERLLGGETISVFVNANSHDLFAAPTLTATPVADGYVLNGSLPCVRHGDVAHEFLVAAQIEGIQLAVFHLPRSTPGLALEPFRLMDAVGAARLEFVDVRIANTARLEFDAPARDVVTVVTDALEWGVIGAVAEAAAMAQVVNAATFEYLGTRQQFGVPLASFQALQHRAADMHIAAEELVAIADAAIDAFDGNNSAERSALVSAAKAVADRAGRLISHDAIQLHGGMGVSDELNISHFARRFAVIRAEWGAADLHRLRFGKLL